MGTSIVRARWAAIGAAVAVTLGAGGGIGWLAHADSAPSTFVGITPCRLFDTRPGSPVGDRTTPLAAGETFARQVWGTNGGCTIPSTATGISYNLTAPDPTVTGFIKLFPAGAAAPNASAINPVAGGGTKANSGIVSLSATGGISFVTQSGPIDLLLDITGYFVPSTGSPGPAGPPGMAGTPGAPGTQGLDGPRGLSAWDTIPSGQTVTGNWGTSNQYSAAFPIVNFSVPLPAKASAALTDAQVNFAPSIYSATADVDLSCTGTAATPTAPPGKICLYLYKSSLSTATILEGDAAHNANTQAFYVDYAIPAPAAGTTTNVTIFLTWAYTAP